MSFREVMPHQLSAYPYTAIGLIQVQWPDRSWGIGTAAVIGVNDILTAAHVVYSPDNGGWASKIEFYFGADYNSATGYFDNDGYVLDSGFGWEIKAYTANVFADGDNNTLTSAESQYDVAIIGVSVDVGNQTGWFGINPDRDYTQSVNATGYPAGSTGMMTEIVTVNSSPWWGVYQGISQMGPGSSGGPLYTDDHYLIGVRTSGSGPGTQGTWSDIGFSWDWISEVYDENDHLLGNEPEPTYVLSSQTKAVNEGESARFTLITTNVAAYTTLTYTLSGVQSNDIVDGRLSGTALVGTDGKAVITVPIKKDLITDGDETLRVTIGPASASVVVKDTSKVINYADGARYVGDVINGMLQGHGTLTWADGDRYVGQFASSQMEGNGTLTFADGSTYIGSFRNGSYHGQGILTFSDGHISTGEFVNGVLQAGTYTVHADQSRIYEGESAVILVTATSYHSGVPVPFTISGIQAEDVADGKLDGTLVFDVHGNASISVPTALDAVREGEETLTVAVRGATATIVLSDTIQGSPGQDIIRYEHASKNYAASLNSNNEIEVIYHNGVTERLIGVRRLEFGDESIATDDLTYVGNFSDVSDSASHAAHRFYNTKDKAFFYTTSTDEKNNILLSSSPNASALADTSWPYVYQGATFAKAHSYMNSTPLYRFYNVETGHHFFTASGQEAAMIRAKSESGEWPFNFEGVAFNVYASDPNPTSVGSEIAVHRLYSEELNRHFFTASDAEMQEIQLTGQWNYEGIGFWGEIV